MEEYWLKWRNVEEEQPDYKEVVLITDRNHSELLLPKGK